MKLKIGFPKGLTIPFMAFAALMLAHTIWGANFVIAKKTLEEFPVMSLAFLRFSLSCLFIAPFLYLESRFIKINIKAKDLPRLFIVGLLIVTFHITFFFEGLNRTTAINAAVLSLVVPILSVIGGWWFLKEKIYWVNLFGILLSLAGALVVMKIPLLLTGNYSNEYLVGNILILISGVFIVAGMILSKQLLKTYSSLVVTVVAFLVGVITFLIPAALEYYQDPQWIFKITIYGYLGLIYITLLSSISAYFLFEWALGKVGVIKSGLFQYIEPAVAATLAIQFFGDRISYSFIIGTCLIALGVYWGTVGKHEHLHNHFKPHH